MYNEMTQALMIQDEDANVIVKGVLASKLSELKEMNNVSQGALNNTFIFFEEVFKEGQELLILVTEMTVNKRISKYIYAHGCEKYYQHNKQLLFEDKQNELMEKIEAINLLSLGD
mgnify:CR=1 FL=1